MLNIASWPVSEVLCLYLIIDKNQTTMSTGHKRHGLVSFQIT